MYSRGKKALCLGSVLLVLGIPGLVYVVREAAAYAVKPDLWEGDRVETRPCRRCGGSGKDEGLAEEAPMLGGRCPFCRGKGRVEVILPGPRRPTRVWGVVVSAAAREEVLEEPNLRFAPDPFGVGSKAPRGGIGRASLIFRPEGGEEIRVTADAYGRFSRRLPPGTYALRVEAPGREPMEETIEVKPLTEPIWQERATMVEPEDPESARGHWGLNLQVGLASRGGEEDGFVRVWAGGF
jgi:hypothetical protein